MSSFYTVLAMQKHDDQSSVIPQHLVEKKNLGSPLVNRVREYDTTVKTFLLTEREASNPSIVFKKKRKEVH